MAFADCYVMHAQIKGHSSVCILECGGIQLQSGDALLVLPGHAGPIYVQYKQHLSEPVPVTLCGTKTLRHSHYEVRKYRQLVQGPPRFKCLDGNKEPVKPVKVSEERTEKCQKDKLYVPENDESKETPEASDKNIEDIADNRSMTNPKAKKKVRRKRAPQKAKRKEQSDDA